MNNVWKPLVFCNQTVDQLNNTNTACGFNDLIKLAQAVISDLTFLATLLFVVGCIYVGFRLMTSGGNESEMKEAKSRLGLLLKGYFFILAAWLIIYLITSVLLKSSFSFMSSLSSS
jgi:Type IV secretion system pilin